MNRVTSITSRIEARTYDGDWQRNDTRNNLSEKHGTESGLILLTLHGMAGYQLVALVLGGSITRKVQLLETGKLHLTIRRLSRRRWTHPRASNSKEQLGRQAKTVQLPRVAVHFVTKFARKTDDKVLDERNADRTSASSLSDIATWKKQCQKFTPKGGAGFPFMLTFSHEFFTLSVDAGD